LRRGRFSLPGANYFVTVCLEPRLPVLAGATASSLLTEVRTMQSDAVWILRCATVMPDHVHLFFTLGSRLTLSQAIARLKSRTKALLSPSAKWQENFYDHQFRSSDSAEATIRYIHQNPYRAGLVRSHESWPHFHCHPDDWSWFEPLTDSGEPFPEWLR
jgi:REP element-mobilizing transposase RayT